MSANSALNLAGPDFPADASARQKLGHAVKFASLAAFMDEWQPWQFRLSDSFVELVTHSGRAVPPDDSSERELMISCGGALLHLKVALKHFGCLGRVEVFPDLAQAGLVARVHHGFGPAGGPHETALFEAMTRGEEPPSSTEAPVDESFLEMFHDTLPAEKAWLEFSQSDSSRNRLVALAESGAGISKPGLQRQSPSESLRVAQWARPLLTFVVRGADSGQITIATGRRPADDLAALAVIKTKTDDKHGWLATGRAMARARLLARASQISSLVFGQAFQNRRVREELRTSIGHKGFVQAIIGFGSLSAQWPQAAPAQPLADHEFESDTLFFPRRRPD